MNFHWPSYESSFISVLWRIQTLRVLSGLNLNIFIYSYWGQRHFLASTQGCLPKTKVVNSSFTLIYAPALRSLNCSPVWQAGARLTVSSAGRRVGWRNGGVNNKVNLLWINLPLYYIYSCPSRCWEMSPQEEKKPCWKLREKGSKDCYLRKCSLTSSTFPINLLTIFKCLQCDSVTYLTYNVWVSNS